MALDVQETKNESFANMGIATDLQKKAFTETYYYHVFHD